MPHAALWVVQLKLLFYVSCEVNVSMPHAALWVVQLFGDVVPPGDLTFQCRTRLCGWCNVPCRIVVLNHLWVSMPHAALWVVQHANFSLQYSLPLFVSMPHAALWVVQRKRGFKTPLFLAVSMPHAALWVVQR